MSEVGVLPMSLQLKHALDAVRKMTPDEHVDLLIKSGALSRAQRTRALQRLRKASRRRTP